MERVDGIIDKILKELGIHRAFKENEAVVLWNEIKEEFGLGESNALYVRRGTLYIEARSPSLRQKVLMLKRPILKKLEERGVKIQDIRFGRRMEK